MGLMLAICYKNQNKILSETNSLLQSEFMYQTVTAELFHSSTFPKSKKDHSVSETLLKHMVFLLWKHQKSVINSQEL